MTFPFCRVEGIVEGMDESEVRFVPSIRSSRRPRKPGPHRKLYDQLTQDPDKATRVTRRGFPTFLCEDRFGKFAVWVKKHPGSTMSQEQKAVATLLSKGGASVYMWDPDTDKLRDALGVTIPSNKIRDAP